MRRTLLLLLVVFWASGCTSFQLTRVRNDLARQAPEARIGDGYAISFGSISLGLARWITGMSDDEDGAIANAMLSEVRRVQLGRFTINGAFDAYNLRTPGPLQHHLERDDWFHLATIREESEAVWVVYKEDDGIVVDLLVVVMGEEELVLAKISGDLNGVVAAALSQRDIEIPFIVDDGSVAENLADDAMLEAVREFIP